MGKLIGVTGPEDDEGDPPAGLGEPESDGEYDGPVGSIEDDK